MLNGERAYVPFCGRVVKMVDVMNGCFGCVDVVESLRENAFLGA